MNTESEDRITPLITIGITCYNARDTIARAITSALAQTWPNKEILIVDDCSTDGSDKIIEEMAGNYAGIRHIRHEHNKGPGGARQTILENAAGEFIAFFDDDDESKPDRIQKQYRKISSYEQKTGEKMIACYASGERIYENGYNKPLPAIGSQGGIPYGPDVADYILFYKRRRKWFYGSGTPTCSLMARRSVLLEAGGFDESFRRIEDLDLAVRLALKGANFTGSPEILFTQYATSAPDKAPEKNLEAEQKLADKHREYLISKGMYKYARLWPEIRYYHFKKDYLRMVGVLLNIFLNRPVKTIIHFFDTAPKRLLHEIKISGKEKQ
jgi:glycosyltransferase involved in cell wall biosynthesis